MDALATAPSKIATSAIHNTGTLRLEQYPIGMGLPETVQAWLTQHASDDIFMVPQWFSELALFQNEAAPTAVAPARFWLVVYQQDVPVLAAPLEQFAGRLGRTEFGLFTNYYSPLIELTVDTSLIARTEAWALLVRAIDQLSPGWLALRLTPLRTQQQEQVEAGLGKRYATYAKEISANHTVAIPDIALYWKSRSSRLNTTIKRKGKSLAKADHRFELLHRPSAEQIADYWEIYRHSWKIQEPTPRFINWLICWGAEQGFLRLGLLYVDNAVVACQLWLFNKRVGHIFKLAQNQKADQYSPGTLLTEFMINSLVAQDGMNKIDFLLGDDGFKPTWMDQREVIVWVEVVNSRSILGKMLTLYYAVRAKLRPAAKKDAAEPQSGGEES